MVVRNEAHRYLRSSLEALIDQVDEIFVFDDQSTDCTVDIVREYADVVGVRGNDTPTFMENESDFRQAALRALEFAMSPQYGDWILAIDADEFLVTTTLNEPVRISMRKAISKAIYGNRMSVRVPIPEVFGWDDDIPLVRTDGFWGSIRGTRLYAWQPNGVFNGKPMASGSEPTYVEQSLVSDEYCGVHLMHFGYANQKDVAEKFVRYSNNDGHNSSHVLSIVTNPTLARWPGPIPNAPNLQDFVPKSFDTFDDS
jgi:glycosyltransferase involved in cell wall biosynthesis